MKEIVNKIRILDGSQLKWIAMFSMLCDHVNKGILFQVLYIKEYSPYWLEKVSDGLEILGRAAFPIFLFLLVEGFKHTRSKPKYFINLMIFGILSEIPYDLFESAELIDQGGQNMFFTLALALLVLWLIDTIKVKYPKYYLIPALFITLVGSYLSAVLALDYTYYGIIIPVFFYLLYHSRPLASLLSYLVVIQEFMSFTGFILVNMYNGKRGKINKWIGYYFYPVHLLIIGLIRVFVLKA